MLNGVIAYIKKSDYLQQMPDSESGIINLLSPFNMPDKKVIFIAFPIEDETQRDFLKGHTKLVHCPFEYIDMSVKQSYDVDWKDRVRTRIRRSNGVIVLVSKNSLTSSGQKWEIKCAREEGKPILAIWAYTTDRTVLEGLSTKLWTWETIGAFIDKV